jgi:DNA polymerase III subunit delta
MANTAQAIFRDLESGKTKPFYLVVGEEPFQAAEIFERVKAFFVKEGESSTFLYETWEGEGLDGRGFLESLNTLPGLFDDAGSLRFVVCQRFEKASAGALEILDGYFKNPSDTTCVFLLASKVDKRKSWYKQVLEKGYVVEVTEPTQRDWPRWQTYFEKKIGKKFEGGAWELMVQCSNFTLSILWPEVQKVALYVGEALKIEEADVKAAVSGSAAADIFQFAEQVVTRESLPALENYHTLLRDGENEVKILAILVRQFRMVEQCLRLMKSGVTDGKAIAPQIGAHPFFVSRIQQQTKHHSLESLAETLGLLADCDYRLKRGDGSLFNNFLMPYLGQ